MARRIYVPFRKGDWLSGSGGMVKEVDSLSRGDGGSGVDDEGGGRGKFSPSSS
jgi:hypothetical protein